MNLIMVLSIMDNGHMMDLGMEKVYNYGLMEQSMKATGSTTWPTVRDA
jgi:hypothetical protein